MIQKYLVGFILICWTCGDWAEAKNPGSLEKLESHMLVLTEGARRKSGRRLGRWRASTERELRQLMSYDWSETAVYADFLHSFLVKMSRYHRQTSGPYPREILYQNIEGLLNWFEVKLSTIRDSWSDEKDFIIFYHMLQTFCLKVSHGQLELTNEQREKLELFLYSVYKDMHYDSDARYSTVGDDAVKKDYLYLAAKLHFVRAYVVGQRIIEEYQKSWFNSQARERNLLAAIEVVFGDGHQVNTYGHEGKKLIQLNYFRAKKLKGYLANPSGFVEKAIEEMTRLQVQLSFQTLKAYFYPPKATALKEYRKKLTSYALEAIQQLKKQLGSLDPESRKKYTEKLKNYANMSYYVPSEIIAALQEFR